MARVLRSVKGHVYAYEVERVNGQRVQRYIGPATAQEASAWQERRRAKQQSELDAGDVSKDPHYNGRRGPQKDRGGINDHPDITTVAGRAEGRAYWRDDGVAPSAFVLQAAALYELRTGRPATICYCAPSLLDELADCGLDVRPAKVNERCVLLVG